MPLSHSSFSPISQSRCLVTVYPPMKNIRISMRLSTYIKDQCTNPTQELTINIPCKLAERIEAYVTENDADITGIVIEALDTFLRDQKNKF